MKAFYTILFLIISNGFMTMAWYGHLKFKSIGFMQTLPLIAVIAISWGIAFFEYLFQVPANKIGYEGNDGPFNLIQLKVIQEVISLLVFTVFTVIVFKTETFRWNHLLAFLLIVIAVYLVFKK